MSCDFFHEHFTTGGGASEFADHRRSCEECRRLSEGFIGLDVVFSRLSAPSVPPVARESWKRIAVQTVDCDRAAELLARGMDQELSAPLDGRLEFHLSRCSPCRESAEVMGVIGSLKPPELSPEALRKPAPVVSLAAARARRARDRARFDPRLYAAAACLLAGFFAFFTNSVGTTPAANLVDGLGRQARVRAAEAADRVKIWEESVSRRFVATREAVSGYGQAVKGIALAAAGRATGEILQAAAKFERGRKS
jgi:hypothetical protein